MNITQKRTLEREILEISDREQRRIGQDLHDGLGQHLAGISYRCQALQLALESKAIPEAADAGKIADLLGDAMAQARALARGLHVVELESAGLGAALVELGSRVKDYFGVSCVCKGNVHVYDRAAALHLYRIAQEAITNAMKHGRAQRIDVELSEVDERVELRIRDDGVGFQEPPHGGRGTGMHIMHQRARAIGASLDVQSRDGAGTVVICTYRNQPT